jgi:lipoate-protein ligase A
MLTILETKKESPEKIMSIDSELLSHLKNDPILHLYRFEGRCATYGYFVKLEDLVDLERAKQEEIRFARRPTGGGVVFHIWDLAFSFLLPASHPKFSKIPLENYQFVNSIVLEALNLDSAQLTPDAFEEPAHCHRFCMARPTEYDVIYRGKKLAGAAQRKTKKGYLHQGTVSIGPPDVDLLKNLLLEKEVVQAMQSYTFSLVDSVGKIEEARRRVEERLKTLFQQILAS